MPEPVANCSRGGVRSALFALAVLVAGSPPVVARTPAQARKWLRKWEERARVTRIEFPAGAHLPSEPVTWDEDLEAQQRQVGEPRRAGKDEEAPA